MSWCPIYTFYSSETDSACFTNSRDRMNVPDVKRNLVPDTWTADGEGALPELSPCPRDNICVGDVQLLLC